MIKYENLPIAEKVKKQKALIKLLNIGIDNETKKNWLLFKGMHSPL